MNPKSPPRAVGSTSATGPSMPGRAASSGANNYNCMTLEALMNAPSIELQPHLYPRKLNGALWQVFYKIDLRPEQEVFLNGMNLSSVSFWILLISFLFYAFILVYLIVTICLAGVSLKMDSSYNFLRDEQLPRPSPSFQLHQHIIAKSILDHKLWSQSLSQDSVPQRYGSLQPPSQTLLSTQGCNDYESHKAGIGWILCNSRGHQLLSGSASIDSISNPLETEALALRDAVSRLTSLNYQKVVFMGDCKALYTHVNQRLRKQPVSHRLPQFLSPCIEDILCFTSKLRPICFR
ncbi:unnamed protein product [Thlaspi arvense]|uniref:RNase H type-1 domain-containing protein n=1 Tax=Thlaspi arvense TaxID=13288 RepID=A0AAU9TAU6_THLAR|nr:unnamed protein product [Thlaspi arvense]